VNAQRSGAFWLALAAVALAAGGCGRRHEPLSAAIDRAVAQGAHALVAAQGEDGAWRSRTYGALRDGLALTPTALKAIVFAPEVEGSAAARRRGAALLASGAAGQELAFPIYSAAEAVIILSHFESTKGGVAPWLDLLIRGQLTEDLGWSPADLAYGAWGDAPRASHKDNAALGADADADISSTLFALGALRIAGASAGDSAVRKALVFVARCQNTADEGETDDPTYDDGGFFFSPTDPVRNKAGMAGTDRSGRVRYHSYGSATADGLRALLRCGLALDHRRVVAARRWLERHFSATTNPGVFEPARAADRDATYFYYAWSLSHAFRALGGRMQEGEGTGTAWAEFLARELIRRQRGDGTWVNRFTASKEDDPLVATPLALGALGLCRTFVAP
jgi:squalene-hopene/tetraprenyl-beta-curcumene cyclase